MWKYLGLKYHYVYNLLSSLAVGRGIRDVSAGTFSSCCLPLRWPWIALAIMDMVLNLHTLFKSEASFISKMWLDWFIMFWSFCSIFPARRVGGTTVMSFTQYWRYLSLLYSLACIHVIHAVSAKWMIWARLFLLLNMKHLEPTKVDRII